MWEAKATLPTVTGLRPYQACLLVKKYLDTGAWLDVKDYAYKENVFETSRKSTSDRYSHHLVKMLSTLDEKQLGVVADGNEKDRLAMLWLGFCLSFPLVGTFATDIVCEKFRNRSYSLKPEDLWEYLSDRSIDYSNLADISDAMRSKAKSVIFYNLRDAGYLNSLNEIQPAYLSSLAKDAIGYKNLRFFPGEDK